MTTLAHRIDALITSKDLPWKRRGRAVEVRLWRNGRRQRVTINRVDDRYLFKSTVADPAYVTRTHRTWRNLAYRVWRKNAAKDLVTFAFDEDDRLVGVIEQPAATLDDPELEFYVDTLARECDRFEYVLTGGDVE